MKQTTRSEALIRALSKATAQSRRNLISAILVYLIGAGVVSAQTQNQRYDTESMAVKSRAEQAAGQCINLWLGRSGR